MFKLNEREHGPYFEISATEASSVALPVRGGESAVISFYPFNEVADSIVVVLLFYVHGKQPKSYRDGQLTNLTTLFLGRLRPPKRLTSTLCTYFHQ